MKQGFEDGDYIELSGNEGCNIGLAVWGPHQSKPELVGFIGPCGRFFTPAKLGMLVQQAHEDAAFYENAVVLFGEDFVCMAEQLIAEGLLRPTPARGSQVQVWRKG